MIFPICPECGQSVENDDENYELEGETWHMWCAVLAGLAEDETF